MFVSGTPPTVAVVAFAAVANPDPVTVIVCPPSAGLLSGLIAVIVGRVAMV
jgi:hypothetical protein